MAITIALAGNPNSGKTTLFNALTGFNQYVGNWPGVTVEKKEGTLKEVPEVTIIDLPGIYSLSPYSLEEVVARDCLIDSTPDVLVNVVDGSNLERNLYLTSQLLELGVPMVVAVNMIDVVRKSGDELNIEILSRKLGCPVVEISALKGDGIADLVQVAIDAGKHSRIPAVVHSYGDDVEAALTEIVLSLPSSVSDSQKRFVAVKLFERDEHMVKRIGENAGVDEAITAVESAHDDDSMSIIATQRYGHLSTIVSASLKRKREVVYTTSDKIDRVVTNRWLALPIFALVMFLVYYVSVTSIGTLVTDWTNDVLFGEIIPPAVEGILTSLNTSPWLQGLVLDGIVGGVGAVLGFVPQMLVLFLLLSFLETSGYMARIAFIMDRVFRKVGLSGKSFIPILIGTGCGVPGIMASRAIENDNDRRMTVITTTFIPCGAKLPIIALIAGALFGGAWWVAPSAYFVGIGAIIASGIILKKTSLFSGDTTPFIMELPAYRWPTVGSIARTTWERGWSFIRKAGTVVLLSTIFVWFSSNFGFVGGRFGMVEDLSQGLLATIGKSVAWIFAPLGWGDWQATVATVTGLVAKENVVGTLGVLYGFGEVAEDGAEIWGALAASFTALSAYSFLVFNLLCAPCFAAIGAIKQEMNSAKWTWIAIGYQTGFAYTVAFCLYQLGMLVTQGIFGVGAVVAIGLVIGFVYLLTRSPRSANTRAPKVALEA